MHARFAISSLCLASALASAAVAQSPVDREILSVGITPSPGAAGAHGYFDLNVVWTVKASPATATLSAGTIIQVFKNGAPNPIFTDVVPVVISGGSGFCGVGGCLGSCGGGYIDGVLNTLLCLVDPPCTPSFCDCDCRFPSILSPMGSDPFEEGDQLTVRLIAAPGAIPEPSGPNNSWSTVFDGKPYFWEHRVVGVDTVPASSGASGRVDVLLGGTTVWHGLGLASDLGLRVTLLDASGSPIATTIASGVAEPSSDPLACGGVGCGGLCGFWEGIQVDCFAFPNVHFLPCVCGGGWLIPLLDLDPNDLVGATILVEAAPGALPTLPGLEQQIMVPVPPLCVGDINGDGAVDGGDLALVLGNWASPGGAADLNDDGIVDGGDLALVLGNWGDCG